MDRRAWVGALALLSGTGLAMADSATINLSLQVPRDPPQIVFDGATRVTLPVDGSDGTLGSVCLFDGSGGSGSRPSPSGDMQLSFTDDNTSSRSNPRLFSLGLNGATGASGSSRMDYLLSVEAVGWQTWGPMQRGVAQSFSSSTYPGKTVSHAATTSIPYPFYCLPITLHLSTTSDGSTAGAASGVSAGSYSGQLTLTLSVPV
ncbi:CfaE/CblD family pilus tip adhesin [Paludibacterium sp. B53371]|uniref:CfaE/CblD family pilus tip adhesin n=1 Tax=Paludibacterium sp. B53371 TaxID=2806263 RepID=UPI001C04A67D|nr:CfaE/CblD family pilus tip adhesin [Paludibacterium sp. B53371]